LGHVWAKPEKDPQNQLKTAERAGFEPAAGF